MKLLYYWRTSRMPTNFTSHLFTAIETAEPEQLRALELGFPLEVQVWREWRAAPSEALFWRRHQSILNY